jgi:hypothetical protein
VTHSPPSQPRPKTNCKPHDQLSVGNRLARGLEPSPSDGREPASRRRGVGAEPGTCHNGSSPATARRECRPGRSAGGGVITAVEPQPRLPRRSIRPGRPRHHNQATSVVNLLRSPEAHAWLQASSQFSS